MKSPAHTVIYTHGGGRLGNQILRFVHWIAWVRAQTKDVEVFNFSFWPYADCFALWREHPGCVFPVRSGREDWLARQHARLSPRLRRWSEGRNRLSRVVHTLGRWHPDWQAFALDIARGDSLDLDDPGVLDLVLRRPVTTCSGWKISSWRLVASQQNELRTLFCPALEFELSSAGFIASLRERHDLVIGLFIRQSDYKVWHGGRFYFPTSRYVDWIRQLLVLHGGRRVAIVVASEEWQSPELFVGLPVFFATGAANGGGHWFESWVQLSKCDFIASPPSTFSATAAFLGSVPLWPLLSMEQELHVDQVMTNGLIEGAQHPIFSLAVK